MERKGNTGICRLSKVSMGFAGLLVHLNPHGSVHLILWVSNSEHPPRTCVLHFLGDGKSKLLIACLHGNVHIIKMDTGATTLIYILKMFAQSIGTLLPRQPVRQASTLADTATAIV